MPPQQSRSAACADAECLLRAACLLEVTARKPGNVHPGAAFADCDWQTFVASAEAIAPVLATAPRRPLGESIQLAVKATQDRVGRNTNLGIILLLAPLATVPPEEELPAGLSRILGATTGDDARHVYEAIRLVRPGGLGRVEREDISGPPTVRLVEAMRLAADRDAIARQYTNGFADVLELASTLTAQTLPDLEREIIAAHVAQLAKESDSLIVRKCGAKVAAEAQQLAQHAADAGGIWTAEGQWRIAVLDNWLRDDGHRRNPGTTADLLAAGLYVALRTQRVPCFDTESILRYGRSLMSRPLNEGAI
jgi:triphosphoribosyl-dephospho-CoA synthase